MNFFLIADIWRTPHRGAATSNAVMVIELKSVVFLFFMWKAFDPKWTHTKKGSIWMKF